ncbi:MAG TPA: carbohydrate ABC transporter permease [Candidatus Aerophobetes bacterium]|uniref:Carbohydrate ABC transporter permease n=1 Tax=Aerophobetes bacterium TaxID=2030807 RepID=A0A7V5HZL7_UNCAE|nr:carbohydrate ABC transporter permease [Candidatus Aerophobetes bacterium]
MGFKKKIGVVSFWVAIIIFSIWTLFPFFMAVVTSFKKLAESYTPTFIPYLQFKPSFYAWTALWGEEFQMLSRALINSIVVGGVSSFIVLILGCLSGYALSRFIFEKWKNKDIATWILSLRMMPPAVVLIPIFLMMRTLNILDTWRSLILTHVLFNLPLAVWLAMDFFNELPKEIEESALIDGCSRFGAFLRIGLPLSSSGLVAIYILSFIFSWGEFLFAVGLTYNRAITFPVQITSLFLSTEGLNFPRVSSLTLVAITPPILLAIPLSKYLIRGLTLGAVKG